MAYPPFPFQYLRGLCSVFFFIKGQMMTTGDGPITNTNSILLHLCHLPKIAGAQKCVQVLGADKVFLLLMITIQTILN